jgi:beta-lactamase class A
MPHTDFSRRTFVHAASLGVASLGLLGGCAAKPRFDPTPAALADLERRAGGKLGVSLYVPSTGAAVSHRGGERFAMASSFKLALAAVILREADQGRLSLETQLPVSQADMVGNSPRVQENLAKGSMSIAALAEAAQVTSDNAATNILLRHIGGPSVFTAKLVELGDTMTRLDRYEPDMVDVRPGDPRDTTTPEAYAKTVGKILTTDWLSPRSNALLIDWMVATRTGMKRLRAGLPEGWKAGDKTGTGLGEAQGVPDRYNDIAIVWPPGKPPLIIAAYYESPVRSPTMRDEDMAVLAEVGRIAARWGGGEGR